MASLGDGTLTIQARNAATDTNSNLVDLEYEVKLLKRLPQPGTQGFNGLPAIDPTNSFQFNLGGKTEQITIEFVLYNDGTDKSNGTLNAADIDDTRFNNNTVETVREQKIWLKEYIHTADLAVDWLLFGRDFTGRTDGSPGTPIAITETRPEPSAGNPNSIRFVVQANVGRRVI
jgi:hypothetical protein